MTLLTISYIEIYKNIFLSESYQEKVYTLWEKNKKKQHHQNHSLLFPQARTTI